MRRTLATLPLIWWLGVGLGAQSTTSLVWDYPTTLPDVVKTWTQSVEIDKVVQTAVPFCVPLGTAGTTCRIDIKPLGAGAHTIRIVASNPQGTGETIITGVDPAKLPTSAGAPRITVTVTVAIP